MVLTETPQSCSAGSSGAELRNFSERRQLYAVSLDHAALIRGRASRSRRTTSRREPTYTLKCDEPDYPPEMQRLIDRIAPGWPPILEVALGWYALLARLDVRLAALAPDYVLKQCKSKFGSLSFYAAPSDDVGEYNEEFNETIRAAEWESIETC